MTLLSVAREREGQRLDDFKNEHAEPLEASGAPDVERRGLSADSLAINE